MFPCVDWLNVYNGCIGLQACASAGTVRCWSGHYLTVGGGERMLREVRVGRYTAADCPNCANAIEAPVAKPLRGGSHDGRLMTCAAGLWSGLCSVYWLNNHRIPLKEEAFPPCPKFEPVGERRPELAKQLEAQARRSKRRRDQLRVRKVA